MQASASTASEVRKSARRVASARGAPDPAGELEALGAALLALDPARVPAAWHAPWFARRVDAARTDLRTAGSAVSLAASFASEAYRRGPTMADSARRADALRAGYALRWLELTTGTALPEWTDWLDRSVAGHPRLEL